MSFGPKMKAGFSFKSELPTFCYITNMIIDDVISYKEYAINKRSVLFYREFQLWLHNDTVIFNY